MLSMNKLKEFVQVDTERKLVQKELTPLQERMHGIQTRLNEINDSLSISEKELINLKLWEAFSSSTKELVEHAREERERMFSGNGSYCCATNEPFDPFFDKWHLTAFETKDNQIRFEVSCNRKEGSISGLMTFLDVYWTAWFDIAELSK